MTTLELLRARKSVRAYTSVPVEPEKKRALLEAALEAPTAGNMTLYTILDITDAALKARLSETCDHQPFIAEAPVVLVFCADYSRWFSLFRSDCAQTRAPGAGDLMLACCDALIAAQNAVTAAEALGLGSCYIGDILENYETHRALLGLPDYCVPAAMLCAGYPTASQKERRKPPRFAVEDVVCENRWQPRDLAAMLARRDGRDAAGFSRWLKAFRERKWDSDFSREMTRSVEAMLQAWNHPPET